MRARSISDYAVEQKESRSIRGAASHIRQGLNDQKFAPKHLRRSAFLIRSPLFFEKSVNIPPGSALCVKWRWSARAVHLLLRR